MSMSASTPSSYSFTRLPNIFAVVCVPILYSGLKIVSASLSLSFPDGHPLPAVSVSRASWLLP